jgi:putative transposase
VEEFLMTRAPRSLQPGYTYHITMRCNNRRFNLSRTACREVLLYAIQQAQARYPFTLYALCIMSNHVPYLLEPHVPEDLPRLMHWLNSDHPRALNTLRYIHANPKAAGMVKGFAYGYSHDGTYGQLADDGLTQWHPAFLQLGDTLEAVRPATGLF